MRPIMQSKVTAVLVGGGIALATVTAAGSASASVRPTGASPRSAPALPQTAAADRAAKWLATKVTSQGYVASAGMPDLSDTTLAILALASTGTQAKAAKRALTYVEHHVDAYVEEGGVDRPGELATLILDARALGANPKSFGGTNLVQRLLATRQTSAQDAGLFGAQDPTYDGVYRQGLSLAALALAGVTSRGTVGSSITWLQHQQCSSGGWEAYRASTSVSCTKPDPVTYSGPDSNSTALAIDGLVAQHATISTSPVHFLASLESSSAGWGYYGGSADPDSTALVVQAVLALHGSVSSTPYRKGTKDPVSAMLAFQLRSGAFYFPGGARTANLLSTEQVIPALMKLSL